MQQWIKQEKQYCAFNYDPLPVVLTKGEGVWLWDIAGKRYLDMMSAYSTTSLGHCHPHLIKILTEQAKKLCVVSRAFHHDILSPFLEKLCSLAHMDMALPMNTGVEAVETALKAARRFGYQIKGISLDQAQIIVAKNNFHGRTISVISFSSESAYKHQFGPFTPGFIEIPFNDSSALEQVITPYTCAFLVEPIQGEAGIQVPAQGWLQQCQKICQDNQVLFILDEVQSGLGRTGKLFAFQYEDIQPDGLIVGKALGGGILPISAFLANKEVMQVFTPNSHGSTFGGNPLACRIALETLHLLEQGDLVERSRILGEELLRGLQAIKSPLIREVRGKGLWVGMEINTQLVTARQVCEALMKNEILTKEAHQAVIRFAPPLIIEREVLLWAIEKIAYTIKSLEKGEA